MDTVEYIPEGVVVNGELYSLITIRRNCLIAHVAKEKLVSIIISYTGYYIPELTEELIVEEANLQIVKELLIGKEVNIVPQDLTRSLTITDKMLTIITDATVISDRIISKMDYDYSPFVANLIDKEAMSNIHKLILVV